jgi:tetratricopeptide (TPR) repeat protein
VDYTILLVYGILSGHRSGEHLSRARRCATFVRDSLRPPTMSAAAAASAASDDDDASSTCFICLEPHSGPGSSQRLLHGGCACRGGSGFGHVACVATAAQETNSHMWQVCPTCKQMWTGQMALWLARARGASVASRPEGDGNRLNASNILTQALERMGEYAEALSLGVATLATARRVLGDEHQVTLDAMGVLAVVHRAMGKPALAVPLQTEALAVRRRLLGDDHKETMVTAGNLAVAHMNMENYDAALPLMTEALERKRRLEGDDSANTLVSMMNLALLHNNMGKHDLALPLYRDALQRSRRVLGSRHPSTLITMARLGQALLLYSGGNDTAAGIALLEEAVAGQTAVLGADHPDTRHAQEVLDWAKSKDEDDDDIEEEEEEETIATRVHKRRRHA